MAEISEFFLFRQYSKALKQWFYDNCYLQRYPKDKNILVVYSTPERAFAKYMYPVLNGQLYRPLISFHLVSSSYTGGNNLGFVNEYKYNTTNNIVTVVRPLLVYKLEYKVTIHTILMSDADILVYQMLTSANKDEAGVVKVDGQWAEIVAENNTDETNLEPGEVQDRILRYGVDFTIRRAYLPKPTSELEAIKEVQVEINEL